jgi:hypothetical protein
MGQWYYRAHGGRYGPIDEELLRTKLRKGELPSTTQVATYEEPERWFHAGKSNLFPELRNTGDRVWFFEKTGTRLGPLTDKQFQAAIVRRELTRESLVWTKEYGDNWCPASQTGFFDTGGPPPLPMSAVSDGWAWALALAPWLFLLIERLKGGFAPAFPERYLWIAFFVINSLITIIDAKVIERSGRNERDIRLGIWFWLVPAYLFQRARALATSQLTLIVWLASFAGTIWIQNPNLFSSQTYWGFGVPPCDHSFTVGQVQSIFPDVPLVRLSGARALSVVEIWQVSDSGGVRSCRGVIRATNGLRYPVTYTIRMEGDQILTNLNVLQGR